MTLRTEKAEKQYLEEEDRTCPRCGHITVCAPFRAITPLMMGPSFTDETRPFEAEDLAKICRAYISNNLLEVLKGKT